MKTIGAYLIFFGIGSIILNMMGLEFRILMWLGEGYMSRLGITALGVVLVVVGQYTSKGQEGDE